MTRTMTAVAIVITTAAAPILAQRLDMMVRADSFAGFRCDQARLADGMEACEKVLARNPKDPAALVWHGYAERANGWLANPDALKKTDRFCIGCHE